MSASGLKALPALRGWRRHLLWPLLLGAHLALWLLPDRAPPARPGPLRATVSTQLRWLAAKPLMSAATPQQALSAVLAPPPSMPLLPPPSIEIAIPAIAAATPAEAATAATTATAGMAQGLPATGTGTGTDTGNTQAPLIVRIPAAGKPGQFTPWNNPATQDPRSRSIRLTFEEKMAIAAGTSECFLEEREPDGSIWRGPGKLKQRASASALTGAAASAGGRVTLCVR